MAITRRSLLQQSAALCAAGALPAITATSTIAQAAPAKPRIRIGVSTYSYWHFDKVKYSIE